MKALILTVAAGQGHIQTGKAIAECFEKRGMECEVLDVYKYISPFISNSIEKGYLFTTHYTPKMYGKFYERLYRKAHKDGRHSFFNMVNNLVSATKMEKYIKNINPDVVISTHCFCAAIMTHIKKKYMPDLFNVGIITDYTVHPFWDMTDMDYFVTANHLLNRQCQNKCLPMEKVLPIGIPINEKFSHKIDKAEARAALGIENNRTIMFMMGSMGFGDMPKMIRKIDNLDLDFQVLCVCGRNEAAKRKIESMKTKHNIIPYGFVNNVDVMMDAADFIITKPGGLSMSESLAKGLPTILVDPIPGHENRNLEFFLNNGVSMAVSKTFPVDEAVYQMLTNQWKFENAPNGAKYIGKPNAATDLYEKVMEFINSKEV